MKGAANCQQCLPLGQVCHLAGVEASVWCLLQQLLEKLCAGGLDLGSALEPWLCCGPRWLYEGGGGEGEAMLSALLSCRTGPPPAVPAVGRSHTRRC